MFISFYKLAYISLIYKVYAYGCVEGHLVNFLTVNQGPKVRETVLEGFLGSWCRQWVPAASPEAISMETDVVRGLFFFFKSCRVRLSQRDSGCLGLLTHACPPPLPPSLCPMFPATMEGAGKPHQVMGAGLPFPSVSPDMIPWSAAWPLLS